MILGIVGGLGPESTLDYYRLLVEGYRARSGGEDPELVVYSVPLSRMLRLQNQGRRDELISFLLSALKALHRAGAELVLIASNTPHDYFDELQRASPVPLLSIVEAACREASGRGLRRLGLLGTGFTMRSRFYQDVFARSGLTVIVPGPEHQEFIHQKIFAELEYGKVLPATRRRFLDIVRRMKIEQRIEGLILGCTELPLMFPRDELGIAFLNTSRIHVEAALRRMISA